MSGFRLAGGDDIAVLVLFTGGTTSSSLERGNELRGDGGETSHNTPPTESL